MITKTPTNPRELTHLLKQGEGFRLEFKRSTGELREGLQTICAFLNSQGGIVLFGVNGKGEVEGQQVSELQGYLVVTFRASIGPESVRLGTKWPKGSQKSSQKILEQIMRQPAITIDELAAHIGISSRAIKKHLRNLKEKGRLERIGPDRGGRWEVIS